jgi:hypothetical protein
MITPVDIDGFKTCNRADCNERFNDNYGAVYCPDHRGKHASRSAKLAEKRYKTCIKCQREYNDDPRTFQCPECRNAPADFIAIDGEGTGRGRDHKYVLLGVGQEQREWPDGVTDITEIFEFLYDQFRANPNAIFGGFFLGYDWNMWLKLLPHERAWMLLTDKGKTKRKRKSADAARLGPWPVEYKGWEFDLLANKRFKLRPRCEHRRLTGKTRCDCPAEKWMFICDHGPFFQTSLLKAVDPSTWRDPVISAEEYETLKSGKERRADAVLDDEMKYYNRLENDILSRLMDRYRLGLAHAGVTLKKQQWFGPGQAAQKWMRVVGTLERSTEAVRALAKRDLGKVKVHDLDVRTDRESDRVRTAQTFYDALQFSYYGGWFEIPVHGHVPGITYEYDINSAYPYVDSRLPCLCGKWVKRTGTPVPSNDIWLTGTARTPYDRMLRLCHVTVSGNDPYLGPLPYRYGPDFKSARGMVSRPGIVKGWYWQHEINAALRAGLIKNIIFHEYLEYQTCGHDRPLKLLEQLYENRLRIGKDTPEGKAFKLIYNSVYGKLCQSEGGSGAAPYANPAYASLTTSGCRTMIMNAIATHPDKAKAVAMVATDGVYFLSPHPTLPVSRTELGKWSMEEHSNLTLFKPGVYWNDKAREAIADGKAPQFKSRGISAGDFSKSIADVDQQFRDWATCPPGEKRDGWPVVYFRSRFSQTSVKQAIQWTEDIKDPGKQIAIYRNLAGQVKDDRKLKQDSCPEVKRDISGMVYDADRGVWRSAPHRGVWPNIHDLNDMVWPESEPYDKRFGMDEDESPFNEFMSPDGPVMLGFRKAMEVG